MKKYIYIHQNQIVDYGIDLSKTNEVSNDFSEQWEKHVQLSDEQIAFYEANPTASAAEVWNMQLIVVENVPERVLTNEDIRIKRQQAYKMESNDLMLAYRQYELLSELEVDETKKSVLLQKMDAKLTEWSAKVNEIDQRYPYVN